MNIFLNQWEKGTIHYSTNGAETISCSGENNIQFAKVNFNWIKD